MDRMDRSPWELAPSELAADCTQGTASLLRGASMSPADSAGHGPFNHLLPPALQAAPTAVTEAWQDETSRCADHAPGPAPCLAPPSLLPHSPRM